MAKLIVARNGRVHRIIPSTDPWPDEPFTVVSDATSVEVGWMVGESGYRAWSALEQQLYDINQETAATIAAGFSFSGKTISLSVESQTSIRDAFAVRASLVYSPAIKWPTRDDDSYVSITSSADVEALYAAMVTAVVNARTAGAEAKELARQGA